MFAYLLSQIHTTERASALWVVAGGVAICVAVVAWKLEKVRNKISLIVAGLVIVGFFAGATFVVW